ncbi:MAG: DUF4054 domain-containing protein [Defluviitaleaceae bacterium]|nr:DUF4054 domain-containing protein [Defluviitaleaceae bacterium]MCL2261687.1 DUF4054 domain-containing protein [Defluviitaleaceae bacterium]
MAALAKFKTGEMARFSTGEMALIIYRPPPEPTPDDEILRIFRLFAKEFSDVRDDFVLKIIPLATQRISRRLFRGVQAQAIAYMTAHIMKMAEVAYQESEGVYPVASISEDGGSMSFVHNSVNLALGDAALRETKYGREVLALRQPMILS